MTIEEDKVMHFGVCFIISLLLGFIGVMFASGLAIGKEYGDYKTAGNVWSWYDLLADAAGIVAGFAIRFIIGWLC